MSSTNINSAVQSPSQVAKIIAYLALTVAAIYVQAQGVITLPVILGAAIALLTAIPVYIKVGVVEKTIIAFSLSILSGLVVVVGNQIAFGTLAHISPVIWVGLLIQAAAAIGVAVVPNKPLIDARTTNQVTSLN